MAVLVFPFLPLSAKAISTHTSARGSDTDNASWPPLDAALLNLGFLLAPTHALARDVVVLGEPDHFMGREFQRPVGTAFGRKFVQRKANGLGGGYHQT